MGLDRRRGPGAPRISSGVTGDWGGYRVGGGEDIGGFVLDVKHFVVCGVSCTAVPPSSGPLRTLVCRPHGPSQPAHRTFLSRAGHCVATVRWPPQPTRSTRLMCVPFPPPCDRWEPPSQELPSHPCQRKGLPPSRPSGKGGILGSLSESLPFMLIPVLWSLEASVFSGWGNFLLLWSHGE